MALSLSPLVPGSGWGPGTDGGAGVVRAWCSLDRLRRCECDWLWRIVGSCGGGSRWVVVCRRGMGCRRGSLESCSELLDMLPVSLSPENYRMVKLIRDPNNSRYTIRDLREFF